MIGSAFPHSSGLGAGKHQHAHYNKGEGDTSLVGILLIHLFVSPSIVLEMIALEGAIWIII